MDGRMDGRDEKEEGGEGMEEREIERFVRRGPNKIRREREGETG